MTLVITVFQNLSVFMLLALHKMKILYTACPAIQYHSVIADSVITTTPIKAFILQHIVFSQCSIDLCK